MRKKHKNPTGAEKLLELLKFVEFSCPGQIDNIRVYRYKMRITLLGVSDEMLDLITRKRLFLGMYLESTSKRTYIHANLMDVDGALCGYLDVRRCWGLTKIEHWISKLEHYVHGGFTG